MNRSVTAALISALVFPGAGQLYLGRTARGCLFLLPTVLAVLYFLNQVAARAMPLAEQIMAGTMPLDPAVIAARLEAQSGPASPLMTVAVVVMLACWIASTVDAYRIGRAGRKAQP